MSGGIPLWGYVAGACLFALALLVGMWAGYGRGWEHCAEEERWKREQARAKNGPRLWTIRDRYLLDQARDRLSPEVAQEAWLAHEDQALTLANETVLNPTAVLTPEDMTFTGEFRLRLAEFEEDMARLLGGTDESLKGITR